MYVHLLTLLIFSCLIQAIPAARAVPSTLSSQYSVLQERNALALQEHAKVSGMLDSLRNERVRGLRK